VQLEQSPVQEAGQQEQVQGDIVRLGFFWVRLGWFVVLWMLLWCEDCCRA